MLGNGLACDIVGVGDVQVCFDNGSTFTLHDVRHVPLLTKNLVNAGQLDDAGYTCMFGDTSWKISKGVLQVAQGLKSSMLYVLHVSSFSKNVICIAKNSLVFHYGIVGLDICLRQECKYFLVLVLSLV